MEFNKTFLNKIMQIESKKLIQLLTLSFILALMISFLTGFIIGYTSMNQDCFNYLTYWKTATDCKYCDNFLCSTINKDFWLLNNKTKIQND
jgi:hypothetical protein